MAVIEGLTLPKGYALHEGDDTDAGDNLNGMFWFSYCAPRADGGMGDIETGELWETEAGAREELWEHRACELETAARDLLDAMDGSTTKYDGDNDAAVPLRALLS